MGGRVVTAWSAFVVLFEGVNGRMSAVEPKELAESGRNDLIVTTYSRLGRQMATYKNAEAYLPTEEDAKVYCNSVVELWRTGEVNETLPNKVKDKVVIFPNSIKCEQSRFRFEWFALYPCLFFGPDIVVVNEDNFYFGAYVYSFPAGSQQVLKFDQNGQTGESNGFEPYYKSFPATKNCSLMSVYAGPNSLSKEIMESLQNNETVILDITVDESPYLVMYSNIFYRLLLTGIFPTGYIFVALLSFRYGIQRYNVKGAQATRRVYLALCTMNSVAMMANGVALYLDGWGATGLFDDLLRNFLRPMFFGVGVAQEVLIAGLWDKLLQDSSFNGGSTKNSIYASPWVSRGAVALALLDIVSGIMGLMLTGAGFVIFMIIPAVYFLIRVVVITHVYKTNTKVRRLLQKFYNEMVSSTAGGEANKVNMMSQALLIKRLSNLIKLSVIAAVFLSLITVEMTLRFLFFRNAQFTGIVICLFVFSRLMIGYVHALFCQPPPSQRSIRESIRSSESKSELATKALVSIPSSLRGSMKIKPSSSSAGSGS